MTKQEAFLLCPTMVARPLEKKFKVLSVDLFFDLIQFIGGISVSFLKIIKVKNITFPFHHYQVLTKSTRGNVRLKKRKYTIKVCEQLENLICH